MDIKKRIKKYSLENKERLQEKFKIYYNENKERINEKIKAEKSNKKLNDVISKLENINIEDLAKYLIEKRKTKILEFPE